MKETIGIHNGMEEILETCNGKPWLQYTVDEKGFLQGTYRIFDLQFGNVLVLTNYKDGELDGAWTSKNWSNDTIKSQMMFSEGHRHGPFKWFHPDGSPMTTGTYVKGRLHGEYRTLNMGGELICHRLYDNGSIKRDYIEEVNKNKKEKADAK